jgi:hypothetical protein
MPVAVMIAYNRPVGPSEAPLYKELRKNAERWWKELNNIRIRHFAEMIENNQDSKLILLPILEIHKKSIKNK